MTTVLAVIGLAALFVVFGAFRLGAGRRCGDCSCTGEACELEEEGKPGLHHS